MVTKRSPARPWVAAPEPRSNEPLFPLLLLPVENVRRPLVPPEPAFVLIIDIMPLLVAVPSPLVKLRAPPVFTVLMPADACNDPPTLLVPLPTVSIKNPPRPLVDAPDPIEIEPLFPLLDDPVENISIPLLPEWPALMLCIVTAPLVVAVPSPLDNANDPPE